MRARRWHRRAAVALGAALVAALAHWLAAQAQSTGTATRLQVTVTRVSDGDSFTAAGPLGERIEVRLHGIDAPERQQPAGSESTRHLQRLLDGAAVRVDVLAVDVHGRTVGRVWVPPPGCPACAASVDVGLAQVSAGWAWWFRQFSDEQSPEDRARYADAERGARSARLGLWAQPQPQAPWNFRRERRRSESGPGG